MHNNELTLDHYGYLSKRGYIIGRKIGEGKTSVVYEVAKQDEANKEKLVVKIRKSCPDDSTVQRKINAMNKWPDLDEINVLALSGLDHPNIIKIKKILDFEDDHIPAVIFEEYLDAESLEDSINRSGPVKNHGRLMQVFSGIASGLRYLHVEKSYLHRDLKSSNVLIGKLTDDVKLIDFQNAKPMKEVNDKCLPTRGGTSFTYPELLNFLVSGKEHHAGLRNEFYGFGVMLYHALTGRLPFGYAVIEHDDGKALRINGESLYIALADDGKPVDKISADRHDAKLERLLSENAPDNYSQLLWNCLSMRPTVFNYKCPEEAHEILAGILQDLKPPAYSLDGQLLKALEKGNFSSETLNRLAEYTITAGKRERKEPYIHVSHAGKTTNHDKGIEEYRTVIGEFQAVVEDHYHHWSHGFWTKQWREEYSRVISVSEGGKLIFNAKRTLGGEYGAKVGWHGVIEAGTITPTPWKRDNYSE